MSHASHPAFGPSPSFSRLSATASRLTPVQQADQARQVVGVLGRMEDRIVTGHCGVGARFLPSGATCLIGANDEATRHTMPEVADEVSRTLAARLPSPLRQLGRLRPRMALALYNDVLRDRSRVLELVRTTHRQLGGSPRHPSAAGARPPIAPMRYVMPSPSGDGSRAASSLRMDSKTPLT